MAILQISKIQQRSGNLVDLPQLDEAEFGWASDQKRLFIGKTTPNENVEVLTSYSAIGFGQIDGAVGNLNITAASLANGEVLAFDGTNWVNRGGNAGGLLTLGDVSNVKITGGATGYVLETDGTGNLSWTPKATIIANIQSVSQANPAVVTTVGNNYFTEGARVTITGAPGMTQLNGNSYYANVISANTFSLYSDSGLSTPVNSTGYGVYAYTNVSGTTVTTNRVTVGSSSQFTANAAITFIGDMSTSGITANTTYYVYDKPTSTTIRIATSADGNSSNILSLQTTTGLTANVYQQGGRAISNVGGANGFGVASGTNTQVQYNNAGLLAGNPGFVYDFANNILILTGNANVGNLNSAGLVTGTRLVSNIATGTAPLQVTSTTQVANLNAATAGTAGTVTTAAQPNITSVGTLSSVAVTANANVGNLNSVGRVYANNSLIVGSTGAEGGQITIGYVGINGITGQANSTWNIDVDSSNTLRIFNQNATGTASTPIYFYSANSNVSFPDSITAIGNITAANVTANLFGNGAAISSLTGANVTGQVGYAAIANSVAVANVSGIGNIATVNLTGSTSNVLYGNGVFATAPVLYANSNVAVFLAAFGSNTISTTGNANVGNLGAAGLFTATGNVTGANLTTSGVVVATGNITGGNLITGGDVVVTGNANVTANINLTGNLNTTGNANVASNLRVTGNATSNNIAVGYYANVGADLGVSGNANVVGNAVVGGNIAITGNGTVAVLTTSSNANVGGNLNVTANANINGSAVVAANLNVSGNASIGGNTTITGNLTLNSNLAVPFNTTTNNITISSQASVGTTLLVVGNITTYSNANVGANLIVLGNSSVAGNSVITGNVTALNGIFNGNANVTGNINVNGAANISGAANVLGNLNVIQNASVSGNATVIRNITAGGNVNVTGNIGSGNLSTGNASVSATLSVGGNTAIIGSTTIGGNLNVTSGSGSNVAGNLGVGGNLAVTGNITTTGITSTSALFNSATALTSIFATLQDNFGDTVTKFDNDGTMAANSPHYLATQQAIVTYVQNALNAIAASAIPVGTVFWRAANAVPSGYLVANGSLISTTTYANLFSAIGYTYGGTGSSFALPDLRGQFVRGIDAGKGVDPGRGFGTTQTQAVGPHNHFYQDAWYVYDAEAASGGLKDAYGNFVPYDENIGPLNLSTGDLDSAAYEFTRLTQTNGSTGTSTETRPTNVALLPIIKY
jgi:hypothetical protein